MSFVLKYSYVPWKQFDLFRCCSYDLFSGSRAVLSLGVLIPTTEARPLWVFYPVKALWVGSFSSLAQGTGTVPRPLCQLDTVRSNLFGWFFFQPQVISLLTCSLFNTYIVLFLFLCLWVFSLWRAFISGTWLCQF